MSDGHEHTASESEWVAQAPDVLRDLFSGYVSHDLLAAGAAEQAVADLLEGDSASVERRFAAVEPAWRRVRHTGFGEAVRLAAHTLLEIEEISPAALAAAAPRAAALHAPGMRLRLLRDVAGLDHVQIDDVLPDCPPDPGSPDFFLSDISVLALAEGRIDRESLWRRSGVEVTDRRSLGEAIDALIDRNAATAVALKSQHAYHRPLRWTAWSDGEVDGALDGVMGGRLADRAARTVVGDWCLARAVRRATERGLPIKLHTGYQAGTASMRPQRLAAGELGDLLRTFPDARFVLLHAGYPHMDEALALAKHFPGVYVDLAWTWSIDPAGCARALRRAIHSVPASKLLAFGGDSFMPTTSVGYAAQCRLWLARALAVEVDEGLLSEAEAIELARRLMRGNHRELYDLDAARVALRAALATGAASEPNVGEAREPGTTGPPADFEAGAALE